MTEVRLLTDGERPAIRLERHLPDPPDVVWRALTEPDQLRAWFPSDVILRGGSWKVGTPITFPFRSEVLDLTLTGEVLEVDEPSVLALTWGDDRLRFELSPEVGGTRLVLIDELPPDAAARNAAGWEQCLERLAGIEPDEWEPRFERYAATFEPALGRQAPRPTHLKGEP